MNDKKRAYELYINEYDWGSTLGITDDNLDKRLSYKEFCANAELLDYFTELLQCEDN